MTSKQIQKIIDEYEDAEQKFREEIEKHEKIITHVKSIEDHKAINRDCLNYWEGKRNGLKFALQVIEEAHLKLR